MRQIDLNSGMRIFWVLIFWMGVCAAQEPLWPDLKSWKAVEPLSGTELLRMEGDIPRKLVSMNSDFLDRQIEKAVSQRIRYWEGENAVAENRVLLEKTIGLDRDKRVEDKEVAIWDHSEIEGVKIRRVKWQAFEDVSGCGLLLEPTGEITADVIYLPDADGPMSGLPLQLARAGSRVLVPVLVPRALHPEHPMSTREWLHRPAFVLGRTLIGYELHQVIAALDWLSAGRSIGIVGRGEGGLLALYAGALDARLEVVAVGGYFGPHNQIWQEPADRNLFGLVNRFGNAEIARMIHPRKFLVTHHGSPSYSYRTQELLDSRSKLPGKPGLIRPFSHHEVKDEWNRIPERLRVNSRCIESEDDWMANFATSLGLKLKQDERLVPPVHREQGIANDTIRQIEKHNQWTLAHASADRNAYWKDLDTRTLEAFQKTIEPYREKFRVEVIGDLEEPLLAFNARSRPYQEGGKTQSYEVVLDVMNGVIAYGILTMPKNLKPGEKRPVVVCQHGLEGTPQDVVGEEKYNAYKAFATRLAEEGFITFAPQNGYKYFDHFRIQQFKAQSIGKSLFSIIVPQHRQITEWLATLPFVEADKIAFYGLSYGGKSAMRIPPLVDRYCLSICSADFNDWVWKNAATDQESLRYSYANKGEYEIFEWNLGGTFNYAEMATLIAPRPFMVERGHFDGVAPDDRVAFEFAKVRNLYQAQLGIGDRCEIEWFPGPHSINGVGTFQFLKKHLLY